jgi:hypothetical protein
LTKIERRGRALGGLCRISALPRPVRWIGLWSARRARRNEADFLLAGRAVSPLLTALSAAATKYSGYMFIGLIGYPAVDRPQ